MNAMHDNDTECKRSKEEAQEKHKQKPKLQKLSLTKRG
jgi:hypothetical protein